MRSVKITRMGLALRKGEGAFQLGLLPALPGYPLLLTLPQLSPAEPSFRS